MLLQAIGGFLPAAIGIAISPIPVIAVILMLGTPKARTNGPAFALGWVIGVLAVTLAIVVLAGGADDPDSATSTGIGWGQVAVGVLFFVLAGKQWRKRPRGGETAEMPAWMSAVDSFAAPKSFSLGIVLSAANPKNLALTAAGAASIAQAGLSGGELAVAVTVFVAIASITVVGSVAFYVLATDRAKGPLGSLEEFMARNSNVIMTILFLVLGAKILGDGLGGLG